jgi:hypothetical protein
MALEDWDTEVDINSTWETIWENIKTSAIESLGYYDFKKPKTWFDERSSELLIKGNKPKCSDYSIQMK